MDIFEKFASESGRALRENEYRDPNGIIMCKLCHTPLQADVPAMSSMHRVAVPCRCKREKQEQEEAVQKERKLRDAIKKNRERGLTDPSMGFHTFALSQGYNPKEMNVAKNYVDSWVLMRKRSQGLLLWGDVGTGKSYIAHCIGNALLEQGVPVYITNFQCLLNEMGELQFGDKNGFLEDLNRYDLLILDDLGVERETEYIIEQCYHIIDSRYRSALPMILTTNLSLREMKNETDLRKKRIYDRILERNTPLRVNNQNIRIINAKQNMEHIGKLLCQ